MKYIKMFLMAPKLYKACKEMIEADDNNFQDTWRNGDHDTMHVCIGCGTTFHYEDDWCPMTLIYEVVNKIEGKK